MRSRSDRTDRTCSVPSEKGASTPAAVRRPSWRTRAPTGIRSIRASFTARLPISPVGSASHGRPCERTRAAATAPSMPSVCTCAKAWTIPGAASVTVPRQIQSNSAFRAGSSVSGWASRSRSRCDQP